jgi:hypothetical protein
MFTVSRNRVAICSALVLFASVATLSRSAAAAQIVDIDATVDSSNNPVQILLAPGEYLVTPIDTSTGGAFTAWNAWGDVAGCEPDGTGCVRGWLNEYLYSSASIPLTQVGGGDVFLTPELAFANAVTETFILSQQETVSFFIADDPGQLSDNLGGVSLSITWIPEPATGVMVLLGLVSFAGARQHGRRRAS